MSGVYEVTKMRIYGWGGGEEREFCDLFYFFLPFERSSKKNTCEEYFRVRDDVFFELLIV